MNAAAQTVTVVRPSASFMKGRSSLARLASARRSQANRCDLQELRRLLETSPLSNDEFSLGCNRLSNADRYLRAGEREAAQFELNLLRRHIRNCLSRHLARRPAGRD